MANRRRFKLLVHTIYVRMWVFSKMGKVDQHVFTVPTLRPTCIYGDTELTFFLNKKIRLKSRKRLFWDSGRKNNNGLADNKRQNTETRRAIDRKSLTIKTQVQQMRNIRTSLWSNTNKGRRRFQAEAIFFNRHNDDAKGICLTSPTKYKKKK